VISGGGPDVARLEDSYHNDMLEGSPARWVCHFGRLRQSHEQFPTVIASAVRGGQDTGEIIHNPGDTVIDRPDKTVIAGNDYLIRLEQYETVHHTPAETIPAASDSAHQTPDTPSEETNPAALSDPDLTALAMSHASHEAASPDDDSDKEHALAVDEALLSQLWWTET
jgi:hypothetical protein